MATQKELKAENGLIVGSRNTNYVKVLGSTTGAGVSITATGSDTNIDLVLNPAGTGVVSTTASITCTDLNSSSDERLKTNIVDIADPMAVLKQIRPVAFQWNKNGDQSYGVIAQELEKILPELVTDGEYKSVSYLPLIAFLIKAVQELQSQIDSMKA